MTVCGESLSANEDLLPGFLENLQHIISDEGLTYEQIYNADETGLMFRQLPKTALIEKSRKSAPGFKVNKERITVLACANASGSHKLPLFVIGKSRKPRAFKHINVSELPVKYGSQNSAWMTKTLFEEWFFQDFVPQVREHLRNNNLPEKALLILDNAPVHPRAEELVSGGIRVLYLPPNITSTIQPMDQNVLETMKKIYKRTFLQNILTHLENDAEIADAIKNVTILKAIEWIAQAWDLVSSHTISRSWKGIFENTFQLTEEENDLQSESFLHLYDFANRLQPADKISMSDIILWVRDDGMEIHDDDVVQIIRDDMTTKNYHQQDDEQDDKQDDERDAEQDDEQDDVLQIDNEAKIAHGDAFRAITIILKYLTQENEESLDIIQRIRKIRDNVKLKM